jgi:mono/diheme cytochrome c family protein
MHTRSKFFSFILLITVLFTNVSWAQDGVTPEILEGQKLYNANCASCHKVKQKLVGPALYGAEKRWIDGASHAGVDGKTWLYKWIKNSSAVIKDGNPYAVAIYNEYNKSVMTAFPQLTDENITNILAYIQADGDGLLAPKVDPATAGADGAAGGGTGGNNGQTNILLYFLVGLLVVIALILARVNTVLNRLVLVKENKPLPVPVPIYKNSKLIATLVLALVVFVGYTTVNNAIDLGRQQGYAPVQPIKFSHKLHAGLNQVNCQYCHSAAAKSKHSNIPSANVCMNCHKGVQQGPSYGRKEISKIYAAIGFNPDKNEFIENYESLPRAEAEKIYSSWLAADTEKKYSAADVKEVLAQVQQPIEWVRIHNLPDHVYFNHSQHVAVGGLECQTCHGEVQEMEVLAQHAPLSMGWCISCHREKEVNYAQNDYYKIYKKYHDKISEEGGKFTVEKIGGTECQKCHY